MGVRLFDCVEEILFVKSCCGKFVCSIEIALKDALTH